MERQQSKEGELDPLRRVIEGRTLEEWHKHLTGDDLDCPGSRYGRTASACAWWPIATLHIFEQYTEITSSVEEFFDAEMRLVVNDYDSPEELVRENLAVVPRAILERLTLDGEAAL